MTNPIYLIGYMAAGKSTVGRILADALGWQFVDLDAAFEEIHGLSPNEYIRTYGIEQFRRKEKYVLEDLADMAPTEEVVYATGGGYPTYEDNMECLSELGTSFYIQWSAEDLVKRLMLTDLSSRPVLEGKTYEELLQFVTPHLEARLPFYEQADYTVTAPGFIPEADQQIANTILEIIQSL